MVLTPHNSSLFAPYHPKQVVNIKMDLKKVTFYNTLGTFIHWKFVLTNEWYQNATLLSFVGHMRQREISNHGTSDVTCLR